MSLLRRTAHSIKPNLGPALPATFTATRHAPLTSPTASPCAGRRSFHLASTVGDTIRVTADAFSWIHVNVGLPWYVTIPLLAVGVNATFRFPLQLYTARLREKRNELTPLLSAWVHRHATNILQQQKDVPERIWRLRTASSTEKSRRRIYKNFGVQRWKGMTPLLSIFPFLTISEALRRKCGAPVGWISNSVGLGSPDSTTANLGSSNGLFDQSLVDGGCLWFSDLSSMDPYFGLPLICSGILVWNTWGKMSKEQLQVLLTTQLDDKVVPLGRLQKLFGRMMLLVPVLPLLFADLPSAIFLYWGSSFALTGINEIILRRLVPRKTPKLTVVKGRPSFPFLTGRKQQKSS
ncbi:mitochondrial export translocase Oxa2 [Fusarium albosuccineum]|uniref:Mitochondrial export translocase Oxa2 n=1 Tax=Fusarium albosuccineum TaxID=1237068 RepID=A0A8H4LE74_9HYPO|nr:mitochondrial export translocase Oxa2 [Fusarium albosuccineum]